MKKIFILLCVLFLSGCDENETPLVRTVTGVVENVTMFQEDDSHTTVLVKFQDGRLQKLRMHWADSFTFQFNQTNTITYNSCGTIRSIVVVTEKGQER